MIPRPFCDEVFCGSAFAALAQLPFGDFLNLVRRLRHPLGGLPLGGLLGAGDGIIHCFSHR
jgi:hypothetical protein